MDTARQYPIGAEPLEGGGVGFRVWAPKCKRLEVVIEGGASVEMTAEEEGYFAATVKDTAAGARYGFRLGGEQKLYSDPASRAQPDGPHGLSEVIDANQFAWRDTDWRGLCVEGQVLYEMHVGTFTEEGTWAAAQGQLRHLKELGVTCIEMMPIAEFVGRWGWGYDGVNLFAPTRLYGRPDDLRRFIDAAHASGIGVILDVVYNHFGPDGNYLGQFADYLSDKHKNDWGQSVNFDGEGCGGVREFFLTNIRYWLAEFHFDGFRFDATHAIVDDSREHILAEITRVARNTASPRDILLVCENEPQHTKLVRKGERGGYGMDALWNDDFHHSAMVMLSGRNEAFLADYRAQPQEFVSAAKWGYLYQGQLYRWQQKRRGTPTFDLAPTAFVHYLQNHDQVANYGMGYRGHQLSSLAMYRAMTALLLLMPQTPLLFQGQEFAADSPFNYFADHNAELAELIRAGRTKELGQFPSIAQEAVVAVLPDPAAEETFLRCKLNFADRERPMGQWMWRLHKDLLRIRREEATFARVQRRGDIDGAVIGPGAFALRYFSEDGDDRLVIVNLDRDLHLLVAPEPLLGPPENMQWEVMWSSEHPDYGGQGSAPLETEDEDWRLAGENWTVPARSASVLRPVPRKWHTLGTRKEH